MRPAGCLKRLLVFVALLFSGGCAGQPAGSDSAARLQARVARVIDGDTIELDTGDRVRLLAVDTPETVHPTKAVERFGQAAADFTKAMLTGERISLVLDQNSAVRQHRDRYGRLLAYVFRDRDNLDFNAELVKEGYAYAYLKYPTERGKEFLGYQAEARQARRGLWAEPSGSADEEDITVFVTDKGTKYHRRSCPTLDRSKTVGPIPLEVARHSFGRCTACSPPP
jgi:micrococcal nuclease